MTEALRIAAVSVDMDEVDCYAAIHGLDDHPVLQGDSRHAIYDRALPRLNSLFDEFEIPATFFVIGRDLAREKNQQATAALRRAGHEVANHSMHHRYDLSRLDVGQIREEIRAGAQAIADATGEAPTGFRAPGYTVSEAMFEAMAAEGVAYDSSVFPCPAYYSAKALAMGAIRLRGRRSHSVLDTPRILGAPTDPYAIGTPYWKRGEGLMELPIGVTRGASGWLPYIGTSLTLWGERGARFLTRRIAGRPLVNLELHGIDLSDAEEDGLQDLAPHQPDLRRTAAQKEAALRTAFSELRDAGYQFVTLARAAESFRSAQPAAR